MSQMMEISIFYMNHQKPQFLKNQSYGPFIPKEHIIDKD